MAVMDEYRDAYGRVRSAIEAGSRALTGDLLRRVHEAVGVLDEALDRYGWDALAFSYNGGKDCQVVLELFAYVVYRRHVEKGLPVRAVHTVYVMSEHPFPEMTTFVEESCARFGLEVAEIRAGGSMRRAFEQYLSQTPATRAIIVGTRRSDPFGGALTHFDATDHGWPAFMRVHPVIDWTYQDIWAFIAAAGIRYCSLYDKGYTSLGGTHDTLPNPELRRDDGTYASAAALDNQDKERCGRQDK